MRAPIESMSAPVARCAGGRSGRGGRCGRRFVPIVCCRRSRVPQPVLPPVPLQPPIPGPGAPVPDGGRAVNVVQGVPRFRSAPPFIRRQAQVELTLPGKYIRQRTGHLHRFIAVRDFRKGSIRPAIRLIGAWRRLRRRAARTARRRRAARRISGGSRRPGRGRGTSDSPPGSRRRMISDGSARARSSRLRRQGDAVADRVGAVGIAFGDLLDLAAAPGCRPTTAPCPGRARPAPRGCRRDRRWSRPRCARRGRAAPRRPGRRARSSRRTGAIPRGPAAGTGPGGASAVRRG